MPLEMKAVCEKCGRSLVVQDEVYICSYECTFCASCAVARTAAANSSAVRVGQIKSIRTAFLAARNSKPSVSGRIGCLSQLGHVGKERRRLSSKQAHCR